MDSVKDLLQTCTKCTLNMKGYSRTKSRWWTIGVLILFTVNIVLSMDVRTGCDESVHFDAKELQSLKSYNSSKSDSSPQFYRYLYIDDVTQSLLVGGKNQLVKLNLTDISNEESIIVKDFNVTGNRFSVCRYQVKSVDYCQNHIKYIVRNSTTDNKIFVCGTNANHPAYYSVEINATSITASEPVEVKEDEGACPRNPFDNVTNVFVEHGNPGGVAALYSATISTLYRKPRILRPALQLNGQKISDTLMNVESNVWLNEAQFVGSFDAGEEVLFFFREVALEFTNCEKKMFSRVAKVCKKDVGGGNLLDSKWTSYQKARLNCSIPGEFPNYFDEIQDAAMVNDTIYGLFTTNLNGLSASAICAFTLDSIKASFDGQFKYQEMDKSYWLPVPEQDVPVIDGKRPGQCVNDSRKLKETVESFIRIRPLMDKAVAHKFGKPIFYKSGVQMQKLVVVKDKSINERILFVTATSDGSVYKISSLIDHPDQSNSNITSVVATKFSPLPVRQPIWDLKIHNTDAYISTDSYVQQFSLITCDKYGKMVDLCVNDPYCRWQQDGDAQPWVGQCVLATSNDLSSLDLEDVKSKYHNFLNANSNDVIHYRLLSTAVITVSEYPFTLDGQQVEWQFRKEGSDNFDPVSIITKGRHYTTPDYGLVITNITGEDSGRYRAVIKDPMSFKETVIAIKNIMAPKDPADVKEYFEKAWMEKFSEWCDMFEKAKRLQKAYEENKCSIT